jgi:hypothetical protein
MFMWAVEVPQVHATPQVVVEEEEDPRPSIEAPLLLRYHQVVVVEEEEEAPLRTLVVRVAQAVVQLASMDRRHWQMVEVVVDRQSAARLVAVQTVEQLGRH